MSSDLEIQRDAGRNLTEVTAYTFPFDYWHDRYQEYYYKALALYLQSLGKELRLVSRARFPLLLKELRHIHDAGCLQSLLGKHSQAIKEMVDWLAWNIGAQYRPCAPLVGEYLFCWDNGQTGNLCIDSHDSAEITSPALLERCDVYVKTHYARGVKYDRRVVPFFNCNPVVIPYLKKLRAMRNHPPYFDVCFIARVWGGKRETDGIEHCLRLFESVAKVRAKKFLLAELVCGDTSEQARRLRSCGIPTTTKRINLRLLWEMTAKSRLNITRLGNHNCMSWRMTDLLALGACTVLDQHPTAISPVPFEHGQHYFSLDATTSSDQPVASASQYAAIPELLEEFLTKRDVTEDMRKHSADYFDQHLDPIKVGKQLCDAALRSTVVSPAVGEALVPSLQFS